MIELLTQYSVTDIKGFAVHLVFAAFFGALVGLERQITRHPAGMLTNLIVCLGAYSFTSFSFLVSPADIRDVTRIAAQVVSGIGFLGAGVIIREGGNVKGLNTAATVWASAAVGILCCYENLFYAALVSAAIVILHLVLHPVSEKIDKMRRYDKSERRRNQEALYRISVVCPEDVELEVRKNIMSIIKHEPEALLHTLETVNTHDDDHNRKIRAYITTKTDNDPIIENLITQVGKSSKVISTGWKIEHDE